MLDLSPWCLVMFDWLFLAVPWGYLQFVIVVFPDHTQLSFFSMFFQDRSFRIVASSLEDHLINHS